MLTRVTIIKCNACDNELRIPGTFAVRRIQQIVELNGWQWQAGEDVHYCFLHGALARMEKNGNTQFTLKGLYRKLKNNKQV